MAKKKAAPSPEAEAPKKETKKTKKASGIWSCNLYIRGYGTVKGGEPTTAKAVALLPDPSKYVV